ncbi:NAD(P)-dependent dehydrogenase (short-subunit alcohol dehydrogenase family) [Pseudomonas citronellolis]|uniref:SDR family NAD(P)-dependent oxidoreductase n=1 Tax=Pseudomonas citronellolis TaxID=53408 RepID=UPI0020A08BF3|nr:NAD(P)-dependent dehydrogenase (short-subunit alcohol dehydrogenase family) [Pseudomonas citronellolis]MCP1668414.1 NAD(P)-dependent dehydrogenase (short-subunit alcohol dehydrogenase family) [Pseudomonas citronellolis]MCP1699980.1 NAD(P)-dependent dehydrogenase (short-subunit alcohol dehydrogenase family) [Pseudomonas citronellolis]MCP1706391.1 NAD(P)-dependent dehydrogenase (short-subunit alcohol dehydrogenase family) [Pseudomonas citronellolis]MCP1800181.1 NAD(P)-dependent dehydrogenase (
MQDQQTPLNSGFGFLSTATEVLAGIDLTGKLAIVTGGHSGLGLETTRALAGAGAQVLVLARNPQAARQALAGVNNVEVGQLDLADLASVRACAQDFVASSRKADIVICNAAVMANPETRVGNGWESQFGTNHLGHYALVNLLWPAIAPGARVVSLSSMGHHYSPMRWDDVQFTRGYDKWLAYGQSKTAIALFARHLDSLGQARGVRAFSVHPGKIYTPLQRHMDMAEMTALGWLDDQGEVIDPSFKSAPQGAATTVWAATSPLLEGKGGLYCEDCDVARRDDSPEPTESGVRSYAIDPEQAERLWRLSAALTGIDAFA